MISQNVSVAMEQPNNAPSSRWTGLKERVVSAVALGAIAIFVIGIGGWLFMAFVIAAAMQMMREWEGLTANENSRWKLAGFAYAAIPCASLIWLREYGAAPVFFIILVVCATDIGAYFTGREIGGPKLAPSISPGKTWAGLGGGILAAALTSTICTGFAPYPSSAPVAFVLGGILAVVAQGGDLLESWLKRRVNVKDSSNLIPGHGGLLDRVDGLVAAIPVYMLLFWVTGLWS
jgi:phosphatidate cytidylyltransferase